MACTRMSSPLVTVAGKYSCCRAGYCHDLPEWHALMFVDPEIQQGDHQTTSQVSMLQCKMSNIGFDIVRCLDTEGQLIMGCHATI